MPNGELHTGASHNKNSQKLFHFDDLSPTAKKKAASQKAASQKADSQKAAKKKPSKKAAKNKPTSKDESFSAAVERRVNGGY